MQSINQTLDATLMVVKCEIQRDALEWHQIDDVLQHCSGLLDSVCDPLLSPARVEQLGGYHVKISTLYFSKFMELRKMKNRTKNSSEKTPKRRPARPSALGPGPGTPTRVFGNLILLYSNFGRRFVRAQSVQYTVQRR